MSSKGRARRGIDRRWNCTGEKCGAKAENRPARVLLRKEMLRMSLDEQSAEMERRRNALRRKRNA